MLLDLYAAEVGKTASPFEQEHALKRKFRNLVRRELATQRRIEEMPDGDDASQSRQSLLASLTGDFRAGNEYLECWSALYFRYLAPHPLTPGELARAAGMTARSFRRRVSAGIALLTESLHREEISKRERNRFFHLTRHLPTPDYRTLVGVQQTAEEIAAQLATENGPRFVSLEGIGGIGKTALAQEITRKLATHNTLTDVAWISARQERLTPDGELVPIHDPACSLEDVVGRLAGQLGQHHLAGLSAEDKLERLRPLLNTTSYLVVVDNLETLDDTRTLLPALAPLGGATRFLLTSRQSLAQYEFTHTFTLAPLSLADSQSLINGELKRRGRATVSEMAQVQQLYDLVGGLPLALKLVAAQLAFLPLAHVLEGLKQADAHTPEAMYTYIYRHNWLQLGSSARDLLLTMLTISPDGEDATWIYRASGLSRPRFDQALTTLLAHSLLEVTGAAGNPIYRLHRLTATFLHTEILRHWE